MKTMLSRLAAILFCLSVCLAAGTSQAASPAHQTLERTIDNVLNLIKDPAYANQATRGAQRAKIEKEARTIFDFNEFSLRTVGRRWSTFTPAQQQAFSEAFANLLIPTYVNKIDGYNGERVLYLGEASSSDGSKVEIRTEVAMKDGRKIPVHYRMLQKGGKWWVYDVLVENLSLVKNYRTQFQDILNTGTPDELIKRIDEKAREVRAQKG